MDIAPRCRPLPLLHYNAVHISVSYLVPGKWFCDNNNLYAHTWYISLSLFGVQNQHGRWVCPISTGRKMGLIWRNTHVPVHYHTRDEINTPPRTTFGANFVDSGEGAKGQASNAPIYMENMSSRHFQKPPFFVVRAPPVTAPPLL